MCDLTCNNYDLSCKNPLQICAFEYIIADTGTEYVLYMGIKVNIINDK